VVIISSNTFISELTTFELIITTFEHNYVYLTPILRMNDFILNVVVSARYSTIVYTASCHHHHHGRTYGGHLDHGHQNISIPYVTPHFANFTKRSYYG